MIWVKSFSAGLSGNFTELAPEVLNSNALQSRNSQATMNTFCRVDVGPLIFGECTLQLSFQPCQQDCDRTLVALCRVLITVPTPSDQDSEVLQITMTLINS